MNLIRPAHRPVNTIRHVYTACTSRLCLYIYRRKEKTMKISKTDTIWKEWEQTCEELKRYKKTLERVGLTTDKKLLYQADYNRRIRAAQKAAVNP